MPDLHEGLLATLDPDNARYVQRQPKAHVRLNVRNGRCADAHGVEIEAQQKSDGTMSVTVSRLNERTHERDAVFTVEVPPPGEIWLYGQIGDRPFTAEERAAIMSGTLTVSGAAYRRAYREQQEYEEQQGLGQIEPCNDPFFLKGECTYCGLGMLAHAAKTKKGS